MVNVECFQLYIATQQPANHFATHTHNLFGKRASCRFRFSISVLTVTFSQLCLLVLAFRSLVHTQTAFYRHETSTHIELHHSYSHSIVRGAAVVERQAEINPEFGVKK